MKLAGYTLAVITVIASIAMFQIGAVLALGSATIWSRFGLFTMLVAAIGLGSGIDLYDHIRRLR